jgi:hypothetical protein
MNFQELDKICFTICTLCIVSGTPPVLCYPWR